jgi:hypothetical protein
MSSPALQVIHGADDPRGYVDVATHLARRFIGMVDDEPTELTFFLRGKRINVAHALTAESHVRLLHEAQRLRDFEGAYMLHAPIDRRILARYPSDCIERAVDRASDKEVMGRRIVFADCDVIRPKGISSTDDEFREAHDVADLIMEFLAESLGGDSALATGSSGNGRFILIAVEPRPVVAEETVRISRFLQLLNKKFRTDRVKVDESVFNPARLMPAPGTWKRKGQDTPERPHRQSSFVCRPNPTRVPLEAIC